MANVDRPHGFSPVGAILRCRPYAVEAATAVYIGDAVEAQADGYIEAATAGDLAYVGVSRGYSSSAAAAIEDLLLYDDPHQLFDAQDNASATFTVASQFLKVDHLATTGSTVTHISAHEIDASTAGTTNGTWIILDLVDKPDNAWGTWADIVVQLNQGEGLMVLAAGV